MDDDVERGIPSMPSGMESDEEEVRLLRSLHDERNRPACMCMCMVAVSPEMQFDGACLIINAIG